MIKSFSTFVPADQKTLDSALEQTLTSIEYKEAQTPIYIFATQLFADDHLDNWIGRLNIQHVTLLETDKSTIMQNVGLIMNTAIQYEGNTLYLTPGYMITSNFDIPSSECVSIDERALNIFTNSIEFITWWLNARTENPETWSGLKLEFPRHFCWKMNEKKEEYGLHLLIQYCNSSDSQRQNEYDYCVEANLSNPKLAAIYNFKEFNTLVPAKIKNHSKYREIAASRWLRYSDAFTFANIFLRNKAVGLCNLDIFLDHNAQWEVVKNFGSQNLILALSRHEYDGKGSAKKDEHLQKLNYANSQDAWMWASPLFIDIASCDFRIGKLGCDNAIAHRLKQAEYHLLNSPNQFKIFHFDVCRGKNGTNYMEKHKESDGKIDKYIYRPENEGQYLLPDIDAFSSGVDGSISIDQAAEHFKLNTIQKYEIICDIYSKCIQISNE